MSPITAPNAPTTIANKIIISFVLLICYYQIVHPHSFFMGAIHIINRRLGNSLKNKKCTYLSTKSIKPEFLWLLTVKFNT